MSTPILEIAFGRSTSPYFKEAVRLARRFPTYQVTGKGRKECHRVTTHLDFADLDGWKKAAALMSLVRNWKSAKVSLESSRVSSSWQIEYDIQQVRDCYRKKGSHQPDDEYCAGKDAPDEERRFFACRLEKGVRYLCERYERGPVWHQFGQLSDDLSSFRVDKSRIRSTVLAATESEVCKWCPAYDEGRIDTAISDLPDEIGLEGNSVFQIKYSAVNPEKALGIERKKPEYSSVISLRLGADDDQATMSIEREVPSVHYSDVAGQDRALKEIKAVVQLPLTHPDFFREVGVMPQRGVILYGPPGNGKTLIAKAVATESDAHLELLNGPEILSKWVGQSEDNLRRVFNRARQLAPSVVLIDEIDSLASSRDAMTQHHEVTIISQLLVLLDGLEERGQIAVIGSTNRINAIDPAVLRPGRFDYHIEVPVPDRVGREAIFRVHARKMKIAPGTRWDAIAEDSVGFSGAEIAAVCREAGQIAIQRGIENGMEATRLLVGQGDFAEAVAAMIRKRTADKPGTMH